jgi:hypothetical protein
VRDEVWAIGTEFQNLATDELYRAYAASQPPDPRLPETLAAAVRSDVESLLRKLHELRLGRSLLDVIRAYTTGLTFCITIFLIGLTILVCVAERAADRDFPMPLLLIVGGVFEAGFSMLERLSRIPSKGDLVQRYPAASRRVIWILTPLLSLTQGATAAIALYFVFRSGLISGAIFPSFDTLGATATTQPLQNLLRAGIPSAMEGGKLFIWSLVAGFAERLVPDLLTRLSIKPPTAQLRGIRALV